jgi:hypothetical protein
MAALQKEHGVEFAQIYLTGDGKNGGGGLYFLIRGGAETVSIPISKDIMLISHTHPERIEGVLVPLEASWQDMRTLQKLQNEGSPQRTSLIVPEKAQPFTFTK